MNRKPRFKTNLQLLGGNGEGGSGTPKAEPQNDPSDPIKEPTTPKPEEKGDPNKPEEKAEEKKYSDKDVDAIIASKFKKWEKQQQDKLAEAEKLAAMNKEQKAEYEREKLENRIAELEAERNKIGLEAEARNMFKEEGINISEDIIKLLATDKAETTKENAETFIKVFKEELEKAVKEQLKGKTPKTGGSTKGVLTKADILAEKDSFKRIKLIQENPHLFEK